MQPSEFDPQYLKGSPEPIRNEPWAQIKRSTLSTSMCGPPKTTQNKTGREGEP